MTSTESASTPTGRTFATAASIPGSAAATKTSAAKKYAAQIRRASSSNANARLAITKTILQVFLSFK